MERVGVTFELARQLRGAAELHVWKRACRHENGGVAEFGVDFAPTLARLKRAVREADHLTYVTLALVAAAAMWPQGRLRQAGMDQQAGGICPRCKGAVVTTHHRFWACPTNEQLLGRPELAAPE